MKILLVTEDIPARQLGGLGKHVVRLGNALIDQGHSVTLMGRADVELAECTTERGFQGPFIGGFDWKWLGWRESQCGAFLPFRRLYVAKRIARAILSRAAAFDVVHYHGHNALVGQYIPARLNFVQTQHDQGSECAIRSRFRRGAICHETDSKACAACATPRPNPLQRELSGMAVRQYRRLASQALSKHQTIFVSDFLRERFCQVVQTPDVGSHLVIHNFCDDHPLSPMTEPAPATGTTKRIAIVARIDETKGVGTFLDVVRQRATSSLDLVIVGDGPLLRPLTDSFASATVRFLGWCSPERVMDNMRAADAVVVPSIWEEPCGTTLLEGLAIGKPVFALALGGTPELKRYERWQGQLALFDSIEDLVDGLIRASLHTPTVTHAFAATASAIVPHLIAAYQARLR